MVSLTRMRIDMALVDQHIMKLIESRIDDDGRARIGHLEISRIIGCHVQTAKNATKRLQDAGKIKKHCRSPRYMEIEVLKNA